MKKSVNRFVVSLAALVCLLSGCGEKASPVAPGGAIAVFSVPAGTVLVKVGDRAITAGDFRQRLAYETGVFAYTMRNAAQQPKDPADRLAKFEAQRLQGVLPQLVHCALLDAYLDASCGGREVKDADRELSKAVSRLMPKKLQKEGFEGLAKGIGVPSAYLKDQILLGAREEKARTVFDPECVKLTEREIDEGLARMDAYTERAVASNKVIWATCSNVLVRVKSGEDFAKLGLTIGDAGHEGEEWGTFERDEIESAALRDWAFSAKVGDVGGPFEVEDGLSVVKLLSRNEGTAQASLASAKTADVAFARINIPMLDEHPEPRTREHCREALLKWKARQAQNRLFEKLFKETKMTYPNGDKLDFKK